MKYLVPISTTIGSALTIYNYYTERTTLYEFLTSTAIIISAIALYLYTLRLEKKRGVTK